MEYPLFAVIEHNKTANKEFNYLYTNEEFSDRDLEGWLVCMRQPDLWHVGMSLSTPIGTKIKMIEDDETLFAFLNGQYNSSDSPWENATSKDYYTFAELETMTQALQYQSTQSQKQANFFP